MLPSLLNGPSPFCRHLWDRPLNMLLYNCFMWFRIMTVSYLCGLWFSWSSPSALRGHLFRCRVRIGHVNLLCCCCCSSSAEAAAGELPSTVYISSLPADRLPYTHKSLPSTATLTSIRYGSARALPSTRYFYFTITVLPAGDVRPRRGKCFSRSLPCSGSGPHGTDERICLYVSPRLPWAAQRGNARASGARHVIAYTSCVCK